MYSRRAILQTGLAAPAAILSPRAALAAQGVTSFPLPVDVVSNRYEVTIDGKPVPVFHATLNTNFISFDLTAPVTVSVTLPEANYWSRGGEQRREVTDIKISPCVLWTTVANMLRVGWIGGSPVTRDISSRDVDVIHLVEGSDVVGWANAAPDALRCPYNLLHVWAPGAKTEATHENYLFDDIRLEDYGALVGIDAPSSTFRNIRFRNIAAASAIQPSIIRGKIDVEQGIEFENITVRGAAVRKAEDVPLTFVDTEPKGVTFKAG